MTHYCTQFDIDADTVFSIANVDGEKEVTIITNGKYVDEPIPVYNAYHLYLILKDVYGKK